MFKTACKAAALAAMAGTVLGDGKPSRRDELEARKAALADEMAALESEMALATTAEPAAASTAPAAVAVAAPDTVVAPATIAQVDTVEVELAESATVAEAFPEPAGAEPTELELLKKQIAELEAKAEMDRLKKQLAELKAAAPEGGEVAPAPAPKPVEPTAPPPADAALPEPAPEEAPAPSDEAVVEPSLIGPINKLEVTSTEAQNEELGPAPVANKLEATSAEEQNEEPEPAPVANKLEATSTEEQDEEPEPVLVVNKLEATSTEEQNEEPEPAPAGHDPVEELRALRNGESKTTRSERRAANLKARQDRAARKAQLGTSVPLKDTAAGSEQRKTRRVQNTADDRAEVRRKRAERLRSLRSLRNGGHGDMPSGYEPDSELPTEEAESGPGIESVLGFTAVVLTMLGVGAYGLKAKMAGSRVRRDSFASNSSRSSMGGVSQFVTSVQNVTGLTSRRNNRISLGV